ncbi:hypothetical protein [Spirosoma areae]
MKPVDFKIMIKLESQQMANFFGGSLSDKRAGFACGVAIGASILVGAVSGGIGLAAMLGGAVVPVCGAAIGSLY